MTATNGNGRPDAIPVAWLGEKARRMIADAVADRDAALESLRERLADAQTRLDAAQRDLALEHERKAALLVDLAGMDKRLTEAQSVQAELRQELARAWDERQRVTTGAEAMRRQVEAVKDVLEHAAIGLGDLIVCAECRLVQPSHKKQCTIGRLADIVQPR